MMLLISKVSGLLGFLFLISSCDYVNTAGAETKASSAATTTDKRQFVECKYPGGTTPGGSKPEVYWINLNSSVLRRKAMTSFLNDFGYPHFRVEGLTRKDLYVPDDMIAGWGFRCNHKTTFTPRAVNNFENTLDLLYPRKIFIKGLCGSVENNKKELVVIVSHLLAIRNAVYSTTATSRYALILEDDVWSPFDINFELMATELQTEMGRPFGIIQFFNSKARTIDEYWYCFLRPKQYHCQMEFGQFSRWAFRSAAQDGRYLQTWSTGAYLIDRVFMKPIIDKIFANEFLGWTSLTIIAAKLPPCAPSVCCDGMTPNAPGANNKSAVVNFSPLSPVHCVYAPVGFAADSYIFASPASTNTPSATFTATMPMFLNDIVSSNRSTMHQGHVIQHKKGFEKLSGMVKDLYGKSKSFLPPYVNVACTLK